VEPPLGLHGAEEDIKASNFKNIPRERKEAGISPQPLSSLCFNGSRTLNDLQDNNNADFQTIRIEDYLAEAREWFDSILSNPDVQASLFQGHHHQYVNTDSEIGNDNEENLNRIRGKVSTTSTITNGLPYEHQSTIKQERRMLGEEGEPLEALTASSEIFNIAMALLCVCVAALAAGLTMGMVSIEPLQLLIKMRVGTPEEKKHAQALLPLVQQHHRLLVTLLLCNSISNEALPLFLDKLVPGYIAVLISVSLVLVFGEILPSAIFTGPNQIPIAAAMAPAVRGIMWILTPVAYPIAKLLDKCLGHDDTHYVGDAYNRGELGALVRVIYEEQSRKKNELKSTMMLAANTLSSHRTGNDKRAFSTSQRADNFLRSLSGLSNGGSGHPAGALAVNNYLHLDEVAMVEGALSMKTKTAKDVYQTMDTVFSVPEGTILDEDAMAHIYNSGHSRIPVYESSGSSSSKPGQENGEGGDNAEQKKKIKSILLSRNLIVVDSDDQRPVCTLPLLQPHCVSLDKPLVDLINDFQTLGPKISMAGHLAIVCEDPKVANDALSRNEAIPSEANVLGIVTLEDVIEELLQEEIVDESDKREYKTMQRARKTFARWKSFVQRNKNRRAAQCESEVERTEESLMAAVEEAAVEVALSSNNGGGTHCPSIDGPILDNSSSDVVVDISSILDNTPLLHSTASRVLSTEHSFRRGKKDKTVRRSYGGF
jgi:metal transporter CNNM